MSHSLRDGDDKHYDFGTKKKVFMSVQRDEFDFAGTADITVESGEVIHFVVKKNLVRVV